MERARRAARREEPAPPPIELGSNLLLDRDGVRFADEERAADSPASWLDAIETAICQTVQLGLLDDEHGRDVALSMAVATARQLLYAEEDLEEARDRIASAIALAAV